MILAMYELGWWIAPVVCAYLCDIGRRIIGMLAWENKWAPRG